MNRFFAKYRENESGSVVAEAALTLPFLISIGLAAVDGSLLMLQNHKMETALVAAGNYLGKSENPQEFETNAKTLATTGQFSEGGTAVIDGWTASDIQISYIDTANSDIQSGTLYRGGDQIRVIQLSSSHTFQGIGLLKSITNGDILIKATYEERASGYIGS